MLSDVPQSQLWIPRYLQPGKHDIAAVKSSMREVTQRIAAKYSVHYSVADQAPESYKQLRAATTTQLVVLGPYSNRTIYGDPAVNHAQRAIHDTLHLSLAADTDMLGELRVAIAQANEASRLMAIPQQTGFFQTSSDRPYTWGNTLYFL